jgi:thiol-disulfide isomerase/thioredoxin
MIRTLLVFWFVIVCVEAHAQSGKLLGVCTRDSLLKDPYINWYQKNYDQYVPELSIINELRRVQWKDYTVEIYFGTWCGDTKREMPRFLKIMDRVGFDSKKIKFIAVDSGKDYKQSPGGETLSKGIYRVATFIVLKNGKEVNRIVEHPVQSLERDLLDLITGNYRPNFYSFPILDKWLSEGLLLNNNVSFKGLAKVLKPLVITPSELSAYAYVLKAQNRVAEAITIFRINNYIFYESIDTYVGLSIALHENKLHDEALKTIEYAITINDDKDRVKELIETYYTIKAGVSLVN